jgi:hypothetical protein
MTNGSPGMSLREYAAIHLCQPISDCKWLDEAIMAAKRDEFAGAYLCGIMSDAESAPAKQANETWADAAGRWSYAYADAMLHARQNSSPKGLNPELDAAVERAEKAERELASATKVVRVIFDGPPSHESGRFIECEDEQGHGIKAGEWKELDNGLWELAIRARTTEGTPNG